MNDIEIIINQKKKKNEEVVKMTTHFLNYRPFRHFRRHVFTFTLLGLSCYIIYGSVTTKLKVNSDRISMVISLGDGRLGNQLSTYATLWSIHREYGLNSVLTRNQAKLIDSYFELRQLPVFPVATSYYDWELPWPLIDDKVKLYDFSDLANRPQLYLKGRSLEIGDWPNDVALFKKYLPEIREHLRFKSNYLNSSEAFLKQILKENVMIPQIPKMTFVGIHIRRTDYGGHLKVLYNYTYVENRYFKKAMRFYRRRFKNIAFIVITDDKEWAVENLPSSKYRIFFSDSGPYKLIRPPPPDMNLPRVDFDPFQSSDDIGYDLCLMSQMNHSILTYGTFGMWGAFLNGGLVVSPKGYDLTKEIREIKKANMTNWHFL